MSEYGAEFENDGTGIRDTNRISRPSPPRTAVSQTDFGPLEWHPLGGRRFRSNEEVGMIIRSWL